MSEYTLQYRIYWCRRPADTPFLAYCEQQYCSWLETQPHFHSWASKVITLTLPTPKE